MCYVQLLRANFYLMKDLGVWKKILNGFKTIYEHKYYTLRTLNDY